MEAVYCYFAIMMPDIAYHRLNNQLIAEPIISIADVVKHFGAMQAQDYAAAKWAIGLRVKNTTDAGIEQAISRREIVRTWSLRGTLQFMHPDTLRDILALTRERMLTAYGNHFRRHELDGVEFKNIATIIKQKLKGGKQLTRAELMMALEQKNIPTDNMRSNFIMLRLALEGITCHAERRGKEFTFTRLDEWIPEHDRNKKKKQEILNEFALTYFQSHGPATIADFAWWSGLMVKDIRRVLEELKSELEAIELNGKKYFLCSSETLSERKYSGIFILPSFDEYLLGYANREDVLHTDHARHVTGTNNGIFSPIIVIDGQVAATWKRIIHKDQLLVYIKPFEKLTIAQYNMIERKMKGYAKFMEMKLVMQ